MGAEIFDASYDALPSPVPALPPVEPPVAPSEPERPDENKTEPEKMEEIEMTTNPVRMKLKVIRRESDIVASPTNPNLRGIMLGIQRMLDAGDITQAEWESAVASIAERSGADKEAL